MKTQARAPDFVRPGDLIPRGWYFIEPDIEEKGEVGSKPILAVDFDGVLHSYVSGWQGAAIVGDPPVPGAMEFLAEATLRFAVHIYSSRSNAIGGIDAMRGAIAMWATGTLDPEEAARVIDALKYPTVKPPALITLDDRAITFRGVWPTMGELQTFKPWNKQGEETPETKRADVTNLKRLHAELESIRLGSDATKGDYDHRDRVLADFNREILRMFPQIISVLERAS